MSEIIRLKCIDCENILCGLANRYILADSEEGCTRIVDEDVAARYHHYLFEKWPQMLSSNYPREHISKTYGEIIRFLDEEIYAAPVGQKLNRFGKIKLT